jgi:signal peptidase I
MAMTLQGCQGCDNDHILVSRLDGHTDRVHDGDIVVFHAPPAWENGSGALVLRVIALGGETVKGISTQGGHNESIMVSEHGTAGPWRTLSEQFYVYIDGPDGNANFGPVTVPAGRVWVMGDHRNDAADSRDHCGPNANGTNLNNCNPVTSTVPISDIIGIATRIVSPLGRIGPL